MLEPEDNSFASELERSIRKELAGDKDRPGLYHTIRNSPSWDAFQRVNGLIQGYEAVLAEMRRIARRMNGEQDFAAEREIRGMN